MTDRRSVRARVLAPALLALFAGSWGLIGCPNNTRTLGEECVKSEDCQSGLCSSLVCVAPPPFLTLPPASTADAGEDSEAPDSSTAEDSGSDADDADATGE